MNSINLKRINIKEFEKASTINNFLNRRQKLVGNKEQIENSLIFLKKNYFSLYFKILINYSQMIAIINSLDLEWPNFVKDYFNMNSHFSFIGDLLSLDCILNDYNIKEKKLHIKTYFILIFPCWILLTFAIFLCVVKFCLKKSQTNRFFIALIVISVFLQPTIIQILFDNLKYITLNNIAYLKKDLASKYDEKHTIWV